tara:strand:+ start:442 stop:582 length:141 start_codon:yes stop_codon:yes gene_type:complete
MIITVILIVLVVYFLGKYALQEGVRIEQQKKFMKDMENFDKKKKIK